MGGGVAPASTTVMEGYSGTEGDEKNVRFNL